MKVLLFCTSNEILRYLVKSKLFEDISILAFKKDKLCIDKDLLDNLRTIKQTFSKKEFSILLRQFDKSCRCFSFGCSYIFSQSDINHFEFPVLNFHTGLIPQNRGRTPLFWDIVNKVSHSYGTLHAINSQIDMGAVLDVVKTPIHETDNPRILAQKLESKLIKSKILIKWLTASVEVINSKEITIDKGLYKKSFSPSKNYLSTEYTSDFLKRLWRCYVIWGRIKINDIYLRDISEKCYDQNSIKFMTLDKEILYGVKSD